MIVSSRYLPVAAACLLAATVVACSKNDAAPSANPSANPSPAPAPSPSPSPSPGATFTITGTVAETAPTADRGIDGATVSTGDRSVVTDGSGRFTMTDLPAGAYILRAGKGGYAEAIATLTLPAEANRVLQFNLEPSFDLSTRERSGTLGPDTSTCGGSALPCARYDFPSHHEGDVEITLLWSSSDATLRLEFRCGGESVATETQRVDNIRRSGEEWLAIEMTTRSRKGVFCEARALHVQGSEVNYQLVITHPN